MTEQQNPKQKKNWFQRLREGLKRSTAALSGGISDIFNKKKLDATTLEELEDLLIMADLGVTVSHTVCQKLAENHFNKEVSPEEVQQALAAEITRIVSPVAQPLNIGNDHKPHIILMVGVNGSGKTTTIGKLAKKFRDEGKSVMLAAGDTFRAAAIEQLQVWGRRNGVPVISGSIGADAAGLAYDAVREAQIARLTRVKAERDEAKCQAALKALTQAAQADDNLLERAVEAARARATLGEISDAMEKIFNRHRAEVKSISGVYGAAYDGDEGFRKIQQDIEKFAEKEGRRPRMLVVKMGQDGHDRGAKVIATAFADIGFDVDVGPLFQTPEEAAREAIENDVHIIGVSSLAAGHKTLIPQLIAELEKQGAGDILVVCGGVIPAQDYDFLYNAGVAAIFGPGTNIPKAAARVLEVLENRD